MQKLANNKGSWPPECINQDCSDGLNQAIHERLPCFERYCHDWPCFFCFVPFCLFLTGKKRPALNGSLVGGNMMNSSKCPLTPFQIICQFLLALWPSLSPKLITFPVTTQFSGSDAFCGCRWNSPSVSSRWHCYASGGDNLAYSRIKLLSWSDVIHHRLIVISCQNWQFTI